MTTPTVTVSIDRTGLSLGALTFTGTKSGATRGIVNYVPPALISRIAYMPDSDSVHGSEATAASWQQAILGFDWVPVDAASETVVQAAYLEVAAAVGQFSYTVTTQVGGAPAQVWRADAGSIQLGGSSGRTYVDLANRVPVYAVTIPVYPLPGA